MWNVADPQPLQYALRAVRRTPGRLRELARFMLPAAPRHMLSSSNVRCDVAHRSARITPMAAAIIQPWCTFDSSTFINAVKIDIDHPDALDRVLAVGRQYDLPLVVSIDPWSGHGHAWMRLAVPVLRSNDKATRYYDYAGRLLAAALGGTLLPARALLKSPWGRKSKCDAPPRRRSPRPACQMMWEAHQAADTGLVWDTHIATDVLRAVRLEEIVGPLADEFGEQVKQHGWRTRREMPATWPGRNCELFDRLRHWAYEHVVRDYAVLKAKAREINDDQFAGNPLPRCEIKATARCMAKWMRRYRGRRQEGRDARAGIRMTPAERQRFSAATTAKKLRQSADRRISAGTQALKVAGTKLTQRALAAASTVSLSTIKRRWQSLTVGCQTIPLSEVGPVTPPVSDPKTPLPALVCVVGRRSPKETMPIGPPDDPVAPPPGPRLPDRYDMNCPMAPPSYHQRDLGEAPAFTRRDGYVLVPCWLGDALGWRRMWIT